MSVGRHQHSASMIFVFFFALSCIIDRCVNFFLFRQTLLKGRRRKIVTEDGSSSGDDADDNEDVSTHHIHAPTYVRMRIQRTLATYPVSLSSASSVDAQQGTLAGERSMLTTLMST